MVLVKGLDLAGIGIESQHRAGIEVVARMGRTGPGRGVADAPIDRLGVLIVVAGHPGRASAGFPVVALPGVVARLAFAGNGEGPPQFLAVVGIERDDIAADAELAAGATDDDLSVDDQRHQGQILALLVVLHLGVPEDLAGLGVERHDMVIRCREIELVLPQADAAAGRMQLEEIVGKLALVAPILVAGFRVQRDDLPHRRRDEHDAIIYDRRRLVAFDDAGGEGPDRRQVLDVGRIDLVERAVALPVVSPAVEHPVTGFGIFEAACGDWTVVLDRPRGCGGRDHAGERNGT